jgi:hypothetical protein
MLSAMYFSERAKIDASFLSSTNVSKASNTVITADSASAIDTCVCNYTVARPIPAVIKIGKSMRHKQTLLDHQADLISRAAFEKRALNISNDKKYEKYIRVTFECVNIANPNTE